MVYVGCVGYTMKSEIANLNEDDLGPLTGAELADDEQRVTLNPIRQIVPQIVSGGIFQSS